MTECELFLILPSFLQNSLNKKL